MARSDSRANTGRRTLDNEDICKLTASPNLVVGQSCEAIFLSNWISFLMEVFYLPIFMFGGQQIPG